MGSCCEQVDLIGSVAIRRVVDARVRCHRDLTVPCVIWDVGCVMCEIQLLKAGEVCEGFMIPHRVLWHMLTV